MSDTVSLTNKRTKVQNIYLNILEKVIWFDCHTPQRHHIQLTISTLIYWCHKTICINKCIIMNLFTTNPAPKEGQAAWPRRPLFPAIGSARRTAQIVWAPVFLQKKSWTLVESTHSPGLLSGFFAKKPSNFTEINLQSRPFKWAGLPPARACISPYWAKFGPTTFFYFPANLLFI